MFRQFVRPNRYVYSLLFVPLDFKYTDIPTGAQNVLPGEIGFEKVKQIFQPHDGYMSPELQSIMSTTSVGLLVGFVMGGMSSTRNTPAEFISQNQATPFYSHVDAQQQLQRKVMLKFISGGLKIGAKLGLFCFTFAGLTTCYSTYTGKVRIRNYTLGGLLTGMLFKINMGIRGMISGGVVGCCFGSLCGLACIILLGIARTETSALPLLQKSWAEMRNNKIMESSRMTEDTQTVLDMLEANSSKPKDNEVERTVDNVELQKQ